jgi:hypothetical protein
MRIANIQARTQPIVIHAPGFTAAKVLYSGIEDYYRRNPLWVAIQRCYKKSKPKRIEPEDMGDLTIITWNNNQEKGFLEECLDRMGVPYLVLGRGIKEWRNIYKVNLTCEVLGDIKTKYVMGLDSYDVLLLDSPGEVVRRFEGFSCEILFNAVSKFYPDCHKFELAGERFITRDWEEFQGRISNSYWRYLNAGAWIGKTSFCRRFFADCLSRKTEELVDAGKLPFKKGAYHQKLTDSEQTALNWTFQDYFPQVQLDYNCEIFLNLSCVPNSGRYVRLYRKFYEIPLSEWMSIPITPIKLIEKEVYKLSKRLKEKFAWYRRFIAFIKGKG